MKLATRLIHFDDRMAVCQASLETEEEHIEVYASAQSYEASNYPDLAQQRAVRLVWRLQKRGIESLDSLEIQPPLSPSTSAFLPDVSRRAYKIETRNDEISSPSDIPSNETDMPSTMIEQPW